MSTRDRLEPEYLSAYVVSLSNTEAEYGAMTTTTKEIVQAEFGVQFIHPHHFTATT